MAKCIHQFSEDDEFDSLFVKLVQKKKRTKQDVHNFRSKSITCTQGTEPTPLSHSTRTQNQFKTARTTSWHVSESRNATSQRHHWEEMVVIGRSGGDPKDETSQICKSYLTQSVSAIEQRSSNSNLRCTSPQLTRDSDRDEGQRRTAKNTSHKKEEPGLIVNYDNDSSDDLQITKRTCSVNLENQSPKEKHQGRDVTKDCSYLQDQSNLNSDYQAQFRLTSHWYPEAKVHNKLQSDSTSEHAQAESKSRRSSILEEDNEQPSSVLRTKSIPAKTKRLSLSRNQAIYQMADQSKEDCIGMKSRNNLFPQSKHCERTGNKTESVPDEHKSNPSYRYSSCVPKLMRSSDCLTNHQSKTASEQWEPLFCSPKQRSSLSLSNIVKHQQKLCDGSKDMSHCINNNLAIRTGIILEKDHGDVMRPLLVAHTEQRNELINDKKDAGSFKSGFRRHTSHRCSSLDSQGNGKSESDSVLDKNSSSNDPEGSLKISNTSGRITSDKYNTVLLDGHQMKFRGCKHQQHSLAQKSSEEAMDEITVTGRLSLSNSDCHIQLMAASVKELTPVKKENCSSSEAKFLMTTSTTQHTDINKTEMERSNFVHHFPNKAILGKTVSSSPQHRAEGQDKVSSARVMATSDSISSAKKYDDETMSDSDSSNKSGYMPVRKRGGKMCGTKKCKTSSSSSKKPLAAKKVSKSATARSENQKQFDEKESDISERSEKQDPGSKGRTSKSRKMDSIGKEKNASDVVKSDLLSKPKTLALKEKNRDSRTSKRKPEEELKAAKKDIKSKTMKSAAGQCSEKKDKKAKFTVPAASTEQVDQTNDLVKQASEAVVHNDGLTSLQQLDEKFFENPGLALLMEPPTVGRQTLASQGLDSLFHSTSHVGGIWQAIFSET